MSRFIRATGSVVALLIISAPLEGRQRSLSFFIDGGGYTPLVTVESSPSVKFNTGFNVGGGATFALTEIWAIRGDFTFDRNSGTDERDTLPTINGDYNRFTYGLDIVFRVPLRGQFVPYASAGGGFTTIDPDLTDKTEGTYGHFFTKPTGRVGVGATFAPKNSNFEVILDAMGLVYKFDQIQLNTTQFDLIYSLGFAYRLSLGGG
jgi:hypothetical protein